MSNSSIDSLKIKAKLLQKAKRKKNPTFALKEAFSLIAKTAGYSSWKEMKETYVMADILNPPRWSAIWKTWFSSKNEAVKHLNTNENYLIPYRDQFFICGVDYLNALGISVDDPDLLLVGHDWSEPRDKEAWNRLLKKIQHTS